MKQRKFTNKIFAKSAIVISFLLCTSVILIINLIPGGQISPDVGGIICLVAIFQFLLLAGLIMVVRRELPYVEILNGIPAILIGSILLFFCVGFLFLIFFGLTRL